MRAARIKYVVRRTCASGMCGLGLEFVRNEMRHFIRLGGTANSRYDNMSKMSHYNVRRRTQRMGGTSVCSRACGRTGARPVEVFN